MEGPDHHDPEEKKQAPKNELAARESDEIAASRKELPVGDLDAVELRRRVRIKDNHIRELYDEVTVARLTADEARAREEAAGRRMADLESERARIKERVHAFEDENREQRSRREGYEREIQRLEGEIGRLNDEVSRLEHVIEQRDEELAAVSSDASDSATRKDEALEDALRRVEGLERDLEDREVESADLQDIIDALRREIEDERELRERLAEPANRLRAGIDLFNESARLQQVNSLSRTLGQPEVYVALDTGEEPAAMLEFTWQGITWQTYAANPSPAVEEPRVFLTSAGEDLSGFERPTPNARVGPGGRVLLGL